jgi:hypothetical protein
MIRKMLANLLYGQLNKVARIIPPNDMTVTKPIPCRVSSGQQCQFPYCQCTWKEKE